MRSTVNSSDTRHNSAKQFLTLFFMKTSTKYTIKLNDEEISMLRDLVRIGMRSKYYQDFVNKECDDIDEEDHQMNTKIVVNQFINLYSSPIESIMDKYVFEGVE